MYVVKLVFVPSCQSSSVLDLMFSFLTHLELDSISLESLPLAGLTNLLVLEQEPLNVLTHVCCHWALALFQTFHCFH